MDDHSKYCTCSPIFKLPTREDLLHPQSCITHEELIEYRTMQGFIGHKKTEYSELEKDKNQDFKCAEAGLAHYNKLYSANYKLVEATSSHGFFCGWVWYHCVFKAAPETSSEPKLFFAELHALGMNTYHVITVTDAPLDPEFYKCSYCPDKKMPHPTSTLSQDPQLLYSEGMINIGLPSEKLHYQQAVESLNKISLDYCPTAYHNQQKLSLSKEELKQLPEIKKLRTGYEFEGASDLKPIFRNSNNEVGLFFYDDGQNEEIEEEEEEEEEEKVDLKSLTWEDVLYNHLRIRRKKKMNHVPGTPSVFGNASYLQAGQEHQKGPSLSFPSYSFQSHVGHLNPVPLMVPFQQWQGQQVLESMEKSYAVNSQAQYNVQQSSSPFQEILCLDPCDGTMHPGERGKKMRHDLGSSHGGVHVIDGAAGRVKKMIQSIEYNVMRDSDYSSANKGHCYNALGTGTRTLSGAADENKENIPAKNCVTKKSLTDLN